MSIRSRLCDPWVFLLTGLALTLLMVILQGFDEVISVVTNTGIWFVYLTGFFLVYLAFAAMSWRYLLMDSPAGIQTFYLATLAGNAINTLLPAASVGGEAVRGRIMTLHGTPAMQVGISLLVAKTVEVVSIVIVGSIALILLLARHGVGTISLIALAGWLLLALGAFGFVAVQLNGSLGRFIEAGVRKLQQRFSITLLADKAQPGAGIRSAYHSRKALYASMLFMLMFRVSIILELYLLARIGNIPLTLEDILIIEGINACLKGVAFIVPGGMGIQELSYMLLGTLSGVDPAAMLGLSITRRARDIVAGIPVILLWQVREARNRFNHTYLHRP